MVTQADYEMAVSFAIERGLPLPPPLEEMLAADAAFAAGTDPVSAARAQALTAEDELAAALDALQGWCAAPNPATVAAVVTQAATAQAHYEALTLGEPSPEAMDLSIRCLGWVAKAQMVAAAAGISLT